jgi:cytochrome c oxidase assembly factor CtaG/cytochrome c551/c552
METAIKLSALAVLGLFFIVTAHGRHLRRLQIIGLAGGWLTLTGALASPLDELAESSLSAHMLQHEILILVAAPLLALGRTHHLLLAVLPRSRRGGLWHDVRSMRVSTAIACILHAIAIWIWHLPALYQAAAAQPFVHIAQHASFLGTALLFWCAVLDRRRRYGAAALYTFATSAHTGLLGVLMFITPHPWYPSYGTGAAALHDQQLAGLIMWIPGGAVLAFIGVCLLWYWLRDIERRTLIRERLVVISNHAPRVLAISVILVGAAALLEACQDAKATAVALTGGNPADGQLAIQKYGCWTCHTIPGIAGANGVIGPPLDKVASRAYIAGRPNSPQQLIDWIRHPQEVRRPTPMPDMGVTERDARDIAAYLYTLL